MRLSTKCFRKLVLGAVCVWLTVPCSSLANPLGSTPVITGTSATEEGVTSDLFDISLGTVVDASTASAQFPAECALGGTNVNWEPTVTIFLNDSGGSGTVDYINFHTPSPVTISGYTLYAREDGGGGNRSFDSMTLYTSADNSFSSLTPISTTLISTPYYSAYGYDNIKITDDAGSGFSPVTAQYFRLEITRPGGYIYNGPRLVELDAIPEPAALTWLAGCALALVWWRRGRR
jgi:hypothetical protein